MKRISAQAEELLIVGLELMQIKDLKPEVFQYINCAVNLCQTILLLEKEPT